MLFPRNVILGLVLLLAGGGGGALAQDEATASTVVRPLLTNYQSFWDMPTEERKVEHDVRFEADVLFYDPRWRVMWLENEGMPLYCNTGQVSFPVSTGDRVLLECHVLPAAGFEPKDLRLTVLGRAAPRPPPPDVTGRPAEFERHNERLVQLAGYVEREEEIDPWHMRLYMAADGLAVVVNVLVNEGDAIPQYAGELISASGLLYINKNADGSISNVDLWIEGFNAVRGLGPLADDRRFQGPAVDGTRLRDTSEGAEVLVQGVVRSAQPGRKVVLWNDTDQITVLSPQSNPPAPGETVAAFGKLERRGPELFLQQGLWRVVGAPNVETHRTKLRRAAQVLELGLDEAARGHPVELWGVVTWSDPEEPFFYVQDSTRGVCVRSSGPWQTRPPFLGSSVRVIGVTGAGPFAPLVEFDRFFAQGTIQLPEPRPITFEQLQNGAEEAKRVELTGYVREVQREGRWVVLQLTAPTGEFSARLITTEALDGLKGAIVRLNAVCTVVADNRAQLVGIDLLVASRDDIVVEVPAVSDLFSVEPSPLNSLRRFGPLETPYRRVRTSGVATFVDPGRRLILQDGAVGLEVLCRDPISILPGEAVEVVGFSGLMGSRVVLREASVRRGGTFAPAEVPTWSPNTPLVPEWDNRLVRIEARLEAVLVTGDEVQLLLEAGELHPLARLPGRSAGGLREGSRVACTGVYRIRYDAFGRPEWFNLQLRGTQDVVVLAPPPRLTLFRAMVGLAMVALAGGAALLWATLLRRQVRAQTRQIRAQLENQARLEAELQKAAKLESLGLLAGGIAHDFNNLLTVVLGNITLAMLEEPAMQSAGDCLLDAERGAQRAKDLTHQLLTFAKGGEPLRAAEVLPEIVREAAEFVLRGSAVRCDFEFEAGLWPADVDRGQIGQVVHNLVLNAMQAMPQGGVVRVKARNATLAEHAVDGLPAGRYVRLSLADTGPGMTPEVVGRLFDPYFTTKKGGSGLGLATVHSIVRRHRGHIDVHSEVGHGTVFTIWLPAAEAEVAAKPAAAPVVPRALQGRVLVMDDEEDIRRLVVSILRRLGLGVVAVADGAEAIRAYTQAREEGQPFALAIMDLTVPGGMGGREAMETLRRLDPAIRAIVSSGYSSDPVLANFQAYGFCDMVEKPYEVEKLMACVARVLGVPPAATG